MTKEKPQYGPIWAGTKRPYGNIIAKLFEYVKLNEPCSYTDMNKFYQMEIKGKTTYNPVKDRGGSFAHLFVSMRNKSRRNYSGKVEYLIKEDGGRYIRLVHWN